MITTIAGPTAFISGETPAGIIRVASDHAIGVCGQKARVVDISSGSSISLGAEVSYDTGADNPVLSLMNTTAQRGCVAYNLLIGFPEYNVKAATLVADTGTDTLAYGVATILAAAHNGGDYYIGPGLGVGCRVADDKMFYCWVESDDVAPATAYMGMIISTNSGSPVAGTPAQISTNGDILPVNAVALSASSVLLLFDDGSYCLIGVSGTSLSPGAVQSSGAGTPGGKGAGALLADVVVHEFDSGEIVTFNSGGYLTASATGQVDNNARLAALQTRTAIAVGSAAVRRVIMNASGYLDSVDSNFTYDSGATGIAFAVAMQSNNSELLVLNQSSQITYLGSAPTSDPYAHPGYTGLVHSAGGMPGSVMI